MSLTFIRKEPAHYALFDRRGEVGCVHAVQVLYGAGRSPAISPMATPVGAAMGSEAA